MSKMRVACICVDSHNLAKLFLFLIGCTEDMITARLHIQLVEQEVEKRGFFNPIAFDANEKAGEIIHLNKRGEVQFEELTIPQTKVSQNSFHKWEWHFMSDSQRDFGAVYTPGMEESHKELYRSSESSPDLLDFVNK